jgi:hypothetical protein
VSLLDEALRCRSLDTLGPRLERESLEPQRQILIASWPEAAAVLLGPPERPRTPAQVRSGFRALQVLERGLGLVDLQEWEEAQPLIVEAGDRLAPVSGHAADHARLHLAIVLTMLGDHSAAAQRLHSLRRLDPTVDIWLDRMEARERARAGDPAGAAEMLEARSPTTAAATARDAVGASSIVEVLVAVRDVDRSVEIATWMLDGLAETSDPSVAHRTVAVDAGVGTSIGCALAGDDDRAAALLSAATVPGATSQLFGPPARRGTQVYVAALSYSGVGPSDPARAGGVWFRWMPDIAPRATSVAAHLLAVVDAGLLVEGTGESELRRQRARILALAGELDDAFAELALATRAAVPSMERARVHWDVAVLHQLGGDEVAALSTLELGLAGSGQGPRLRAALVHERAAVLGRLGRADRAAEAYRDAFERHTALGQDGDAADCRRNLDAIDGRATTGQLLASGTFAACWPGAAT